MKIKKGFEVEDLSKVCEEIILHELPRFRGNSKNSISATDFFKPLTHANEQGELYSHLTFLEGTLCNQDVFNSGESTIFSDIYSPTNIDYNQKSAQSKLVPLGNYARLILIKLAANGYITLKASFKPSLNNQSAFDTVYTYKETYPPAVLELLAMSTERRAKEWPELINKEFFECWKSSGVRYKSAAASCMTLARVCLTQGVNSLCDFKIEHWIEFKNDYDKDNAVIITISNLIKAISTVYGNHALEEQYEKHENSKRAPPSLSGLEKTTKHSDITILAGTSNDALQLTGELFFTDENNIKSTYFPMSVEIYRSYNKKVVSYGYWDSHKKQISDFLPENLDEVKQEIWKIAQLDYIARKIEKSTKKVVSSRLRYLNLYLFSYLPSYYESLDSTPFEYPQKPKQFISTVFIERSPIFEAEIPSLPENFKFPVPLKTFIEDITSINSNISTFANNAARDTIREIESFFDHLITLSSDIDSDYYLSSNPLQGTASKALGTKYIKTNKSVFPVDYWSGFRVFLKKIASSITSNTITSIENEKLESYSLGFDKYQINEQFNFFNNEIEIKSIDISQIPKLKFIDNKDNAFHIPDHTYWVKILLIAYSGIRSSNAHWLDADNFDLMHIKNGNNEKSQFVPIVINTDKAKDRSFESYVPDFVFDELIKTRRILYYNLNHYSLEPIPYQNNTESKWGETTPLFRRTKSHINSAERNLGPLLEIYETCLKENNITFESQLLYCPSLHLNIKDFVYLKHQGKPLPYYVEATINYSLQVKAKFTPIETSSLLTPHSLRAMVSSVFSPLIGDELISKFMTGQTESTIGYYTVEFSDDSSQDLMANLRHLLNLGNNEMVTPNKSRIDEDDFKRRVEDGTAMEHYQCQSINLKPIDIDEEEEEDFAEGGLSVMTLGLVSRLAFNRTHICPFNNVCPRSIIISIGEKNCSECLYAITTTNHLPSIAAKIRKLSEEIADIREKQSKNYLYNDEEFALNKEKESKIREACNWFIRLTIANQNNEQFIISEEGRKKLIYDSINLKKEDTKEAHLIRRLHETEGCEMLQSDNLRKKATRLLRRIEAAALTDKWRSFSDTSEVNEAYNTFINICKIYNLNEQQQITLLSDNFNELKHKLLGVSL